MPEPPVVVEIYTRSAIPADETESPHADQEQVCRQYCLENNLAIGMIYWETFSGYEYRERPKLNLMRKRYKEGVIRGIVVTTLDRLSRNQTHLLLLIGELERYNTALHLAGKNADDTVKGRLIRAALLLVNDVEREKGLDRHLDNPES